ncbi:MAG: TRAM domain-containing protein [Candidatus Methanomethyliaceae archaeon]|nr:TRAM domain-containing protein [Candidatus Methanomethyliaceae archaeon]MDW7970968.1 TRAM domain-containing protein [Nitrososphaerota archaeon]
MGYYREGRQRFGRRQSRDFSSKPVKEGEEYEVDIKEISRRGEGIARIEGFVVFVPNTKIGDHVRVKVTRVARRYATAEIVA